jgi:hypothetical protein
MRKIAHGVKLGSNSVCVNSKQGIESVSMLASLSGAEKNKKKKKKKKKKEVRSNSNVYICNALVNSDDREQGDQFPRSSSALHVNEINASCRVLPVTPARRRRYAEKPRA